MKLATYYLLLLGLAFTLAGCGSGEQVNASVERKDLVAEGTAQRWYTSEQVVLGNRLYQQNCALCHKHDASGTPDWRTLDANGNYPPPPLDGTAHTWHHPLSVLRRTVRQGGISLGGVMPPFGDKLNEVEINAILAWIQTHWPGEVYSAWSRRNMQASRQ